MHSNTDTYIESEHGKSELGCTYANTEMMIRLGRAIEQQCTDAQSEQKRDQLGCSRDETLRQTDTTQVNCSRYLNIGGTERSLQCQ